MLLKQSPTGRSNLQLGSANYGRLNLNDLHLETNVLIIGDSSQPAYTDYRITRMFELTASNTLPKVIPDDYAIYSTGLLRDS